MPKTCPKCRRANPADALFCYEDGFSLGAGHAGPVDPGAQPFPHPFVFPNGAVCRNFDQLALACHNEWAAAIELLRHGDLANFLAGLGRADLAKAARDAGRDGDADHGLDQLLGQLPAKTIDPARLHVETLQLNLGQLTVGKDQRLELRLTNQGMRLLSGTIAVAEGDWLALGDGAGSPRKVFQFQSNTTIPVHVRGKLLRAAVKPIQGQLLVETNGGSATVVVTAEVAVKPFPDGVLAGATTPRQIAEKAKAAPKAAAALFETGAVARWYLQNGWTYPVQGPAASGLGAVQQFFEALGLTQPPKVAVGESSLFFEGKPGGGVFHTLDVSAVEKRPIFASAVSDQYWLKISQVVLDGRTAHVKLAVDSVPDRPGETLEAKVTVRANGNQRFVVPVTLRVLGKPRTANSTQKSSGFYPGVQVVEELEEVGPPSRSRAPEPLKPWTPPVKVQSKFNPQARDGDALEVASLDDDEDDAPRRQKKAGATGFILPLLPIAFIFIGLFITGVVDVAGWALGRLTPDGAGGPDGGPLEALIEIQFHDKPQDVTLGTGGVKHGGNVTDEAVWDPTMRFGLVMLNQPDPTRPGLHKRLTFDELGETNNCCVRLDGMEALFGDQPFRKKLEPQLPPWPGQWTEMEADLGKDPNGVPRQGKRSVWAYREQKIQVTQTVELIAGDQSGQLDACLVRYRIENKDSRPHTVGLRFLLDTYIGANDGVPFLIPGQNQLCATQQDLQGAAVPQYLQAFEQEDLAHPGTIARLQLRLGGGIEPPSRVTLGAYPDPELGSLKNDNRCRQEKTMWDVPVYDISTLHDSAVTLYWPIQPLEAGASRDLGFAYGLGDVSAGEGGALGLSVAGSFTPGGEFTVTALVNNPVAGQTVTLTLPDGLQPADGGKPTRDVPAIQPGSVSRLSPVSWNVKAARAGEYTIKVDSSNGASQSKKVTIKTRSPFGDN